MSHFAKTRAEKLASAVVLTIAFGTATPVLAQGKAAPFGGMGGMGGGMGGGMSVDAPDRDDFRSFVFATPVVNLNGESMAHLELNLAGHASLALEVTAKRAYEEVDEETMAETGESRSSKAKGGALILSRYSRPMSMAGFYWALGAGYREEDVSWRVKPDAKDPELVSSFNLLNDDGNLHHDARLTGTTGHLRAGYRYVGQDLPFLGGIYLGARHFQAGVRDSEVERDEPVRVAEMTDRERERLRRKYSTRPECGLEVGFRF